MSGSTAFIGLGSNLAHPRQQVERALKELTEIPNTRLIAHSRLYRSDPVGPPGQPDYINAVAELHTHLAPEALLDALQAIEQAHDRVRKVHWGPRTLDLDILTFADQQIDSDRLQVPHPFLGERNFVLYPLRELAPDLVLADGRRLTRLCQNCPMGSLEPIGV